MMTAAHNGATMQTDTVGWQRGAAGRVQGTAMPNSDGGGPGNAKMMTTVPSGTTATTPDSATMETAQ